MYSRDDASLQTTPIDDDTHPRLQILYLIEELRLYFKGAEVYLPGRLLCLTDGVDTHVLEMNHSEETLPTVQGGDHSLERRTAADAGETILAEGKDDIA